MTDKEKYQALVNYIKGIINGKEYFASIDVEAFHKFISEIEK